MKATLQPWMFPLRVVDNDGSFEIWTQRDERLGSRNNFALLGMIQHKGDAERICEVLNEGVVKLCEKADTADWYCGYCDKAMSDSEEDGHLGQDGYWYCSETCEEERAENR